MYINSMRGIMNMYVLAYTCTQLQYDDLSEVPVMLINTHTHTHSPAKTSS